MIAINTLDLSFTIRTEENFNLFNTEDSKKDTCLCIPVSMGMKFSTSIIKRNNIKYLH